MKQTYRIPQFSRFATKSRFGLAGPTHYKVLRRIVRLGPASGDSYVVLEGLRAGDTVVTEGSFLLRAEAGKTAS
jgi:multidrug efflux pump subunit AcrA (membrane-fusion protein)